MAGDALDGFDDDYVLPPEPRDDFDDFGDYAANTRKPAKSNFSQARGDLQEYRQPPHDERAERSPCSARCC